MAQYIDKFALVAEIERRRKAIPREETDKRLKAVYGNEAFVLTDLLNFLDTLEVKEVDVDREIEKCLKQYHMLAVGKKDFAPIAKHFFELGVNASNPLTWEDIRLIAEIGDKFMNSEESDNLSEEDYYKEVLKQFKDFKERKEK